MVKEVTRPVMFTSTGSALAGGRRSTYPFLFPFPFLFYQFQEPLLGMVVPGPSPSTPPQTHPDRYRREETEGKEGWGSPL